jgi:acid phosphatase
VVVIEENHSYRDIIGSPAAPYMNQLARHGASLVNFHAITHPSEPNYLALFSGATQGLTGDDCPLRYRGRTLAGQLVRAGATFAGYAEDLPHPGAAVCRSGNYVRRHAPWTNFTTVARSVGQPFTAFPTHFGKLPDLSFVIPNLQHDMHDGTVGQADTWLRTHLGAYVTWARTHDSVLILTWDEDDLGPTNHIPTVVAGAHVRPGRYLTHADHYRLLRTLEWLFGLPGLHKSKQAEPITQVWAR